MKDSQCSGFCLEAKNTELGMISIPKDLFAKDHNDIYPKRLLTNTGYRCPIGCNHNPITMKTAARIINNGGRWGICLRNPFRYLKEKKL